MITVIVEVRGGNVVEVYTGSSEARVMVIDWDNTRDGEAMTAAEPWPCASLRNMPKETRRVIRRCRLGDVDITL